jgi:hypothetical protein
LSSAAEPFFPSGRSKAQRWEDASPDGRISPLPRPSYRDVVASRPVSLEKQPTPLKPQPRALASVIGCCPISLSKSTGGGWQRVERRRTRHRRLHQSHPACRCFPEDLRGKCFNCLSLDHRAVRCRRPTCCFRCSEPGHRSYDCLRRLAASRRRRRLACRLNPTAARMHSASTPEDAHRPPPLHHGVMPVAGGAVLLWRLEARVLCRRRSWRSRPSRARRLCRRWLGWRLSVPYAFFSVRQR